LFEGQTVPATMSQLVPRKS
jgi:hypothetical protein